MTEDAPAGRHRAGHPPPEPPPTGDLPVVRLPGAGAPPLSPPLAVRRLMFVGVLVVAAVSVPVTVLVDFRAGGGVLAAALLMSSLARALLPAEYCLGLLVRSRRVDVITSFVLAAAVFVCAWIVPSG
jgi:Protein of unknown function (DUF3017)